MNEDRIVRVEPPGVKVWEALQGMVDRMVKSWEKDDGKLAMQKLLKNKAIVNLLAWMDEQKQKLKENQERNREIHLARLEAARRTKMMRDSPEVSLQEEDVKVAIITTASLPWMTGTAVNPLLRAAYLAKLQKQVTLLVPWLSPKDQKEIHPDGRVFDTPEEQEVFVRNWLKNRVGFEPDFKLTFYPGKYIHEKGSIFAVGDVTEYVPDSEAQIAVLEEPEHLNWYHVGRRWSDKFKHVVGIVHTNYLEYVKREENGATKANVLKVVNDWVVRAAGVHTVVKLSDAVQEFKKAETCFVHGVSPKFLDVGRMVSERMSQLDSVFAEAKTRPEAESSGFDGFDKGCYFLGKVLWGKGYSELLALMQSHIEGNGVDVSVDVFGKGPDLVDVEKEAQKRNLNLQFRGARDHGDVDFRRYKVFINPSMSDVVATTTAEALAMGKFVICAEHPSNVFFSQFRNCMTYTTPEEFSKCLARAMSTEPAPLRPEELRKLSWEAATERFLRVAEPQPDQRVQPELPRIIDEVAATAVWHAHQSLQQLEAYRLAIGAHPGTKNPLGNLNEVKRLDDVAARNDLLGSIEGKKISLNLAQVMGLKQSQQQVSLLA